jgi:hypothetical protein
MIEMRASHEQATFANYCSPCTRAEVKLDATPLLHMLCAFAGVLSKRSYCPSLLQDKARKLYQAAIFCDEYMTVFSTVGSALTTRFVLTTLSL